MPVPPIYSKPVSTAQEGADYTGDRGRCAGARPSQPLRGAGTDLQPGLPLHGGVMSAGMAITGGRGNQQGGRQAAPALPPRDRAAETFDYNGPVPPLPPKRDYPLASGSSSAGHTHPAEHNARGFRPIDPAKPPKVTKPCLKPVPISGLDAIVSAAAATGIARLDIADQGGAAAVHAPGVNDNSARQPELPAKSKVGQVGGRLSAFEPIHQSRKELFSPLSSPEFLAQVKKFEELQRKEGDSFFTRMRKAYRRNSGDYRQNKLALAKELGLQPPVSAVALKAALVDLATKADKGAVDNPPAPIAVSGRRPQVPPAGGPVFPAKVDFSALLAPELGGLSLSDGSASEVGIKLFDLMKMPSLGIHQASQLIGDNLLGGRRYKDILPPFVSVVNVNVGGNDTMPIHGNRLNGTTIATQGPMTQKANQEGIPAFFAAALDQGMQSIVNLTNEADGRRKANLAVEYWPAQGNSISHTVGSRTIEVTNNGVREFPGYRIVDLTVAEPAASTARAISVYQFTGWPDHGVPAGSELNQFMSFINIFERESGSRDTMVHCSAGVGRTGTFIVLRQLLEGIRNGSVTRDNLLESIRDRVWEGRIARGKAFVQSSPQMGMLVEQGLAELDKLGHSSQAIGGSGYNVENAWGAAGGNVNSVLASSLSRVEDMLRAGLIVDPRDGNRLVIDAPVWVEILNDLTAEELRSLAMLGTSMLRSEHGYGPDVIRPVYRAYAEKRLMGMLAEGKTLEEISTFVHTKANYRNGSMLGKAARDVLTEMMQRDLSARGQTADQQ